MQWRPGLNNINTCMQADSWNALPELRLLGTALGMACNTGGCRTSLMPLQQMRVSMFSQDADVPRPN